MKGLLSIVNFLTAFYIINGASLSEYSKKSHDYNQSIKVFSNILNAAGRIITGQAIFKQKRPSDSIEFSIHVSFDPPKPNSRFIGLIHERRVGDILSFLQDEPIHNEECIRLGGQPFNKFFDPRKDTAGDFGIMKTNDDGSSLSYRVKNRIFTLHGPENIIGRSFILYELADEYEPFTQSVILPPGAVSVVSCDTIGYHPASYQRRMTHSSYTRTINPNTAEEPKVALSFLFGNQKTDFGIVLFEQQNSNSNLRVTGIAYTPTVEQSTELLRLSVNQYKSIRGFVEINDFFKNGLSNIDTGYEFFNFGNVFVTSIDTIMNELGKSPGIMFGLNENKASLYGRDSLIGRSLVLHSNTQANSPIILFGDIGLITPGQEIYNLVRNFLQNLKSNIVTLDQIKDYYISRLQQYAIADYYSR